MSRSFQACTFSRNGCVDLLGCAPCPPPTYSYRHFREYALNRSLLLTELCSIVWRCRSREKDTDFIADCPKPIDLDGTGSGPGCKIIVICAITIATLTLVLRLICLRCMSKERRENQIEWKIITCVKCGKTTRKEKTRKICEDINPDKESILAENTDVAICMDLVHSLGQTTPATENDEQKRDTFPEKKSAGIEGSDVEEETDGQNEENAPLLENPEIEEKNSNNLTEKENETHAQQCKESREEDSDNGSFCSENSDVAIPTVSVIIPEQTNNASENEEQKRETYRENIIADREGSDVEEEETDVQNEENAPLLENLKIEEENSNNLTEKENETHAQQYKESREEDSDNKSFCSENSDVAILPISVNFPEQTNNASENEEQKRGTFREKIIVDREGSDVEEEETDVQNEDNAPLLENPEIEEKNSNNLTEKENETHAQQCKESREEDSDNGSFCSENSDVAIPIVSVNIPEQTNYATENVEQKRETFREKIIADREGSDVEEEETDVQNEDNAPLLENPEIEEKNSNNLTEKENETHARQCEERREEDSDNESFCSAKSEVDTNENI